MSAQMQQPPSYRLRPMREIDLPWVMEVEQAVYPIGWSEGNFRDCLHHHYPALVAEQPWSGEAFGYAVSSVAVGELHILNIAVVPEHQGRGLGRALLRDLLEAGLRQGADNAFLEVRSSNIVARRLYAGMGFLEVGLRKRYYPMPDGEREDALVLALDLSALTFR